MAWTVDITVTDSEAQRFNATGTRTDDVTSKVTSYSISGTYNTAKTKAENVALISSAIYDQHVADVAKEASYAAFVSMISADIVTALDGLES